jgi:4-amino-4-deoxy-L-arabinose transferase-like glycosyltransferase
VAWTRWALLLLLAGTAIAYLVDLSASGSANSFYAAAVQAGTKSWKAFFFGSIDRSNFITVDKPPASLWVMELSGRIFGFSSWSMLVPQALEGVAAVALLYASVKRWFGDVAGLAAGALLALTPVAALMFRFNNPDALLVCLLVASAYTLTRALEKAGTRWILATGALVGFAFLAKMMQAFLVLPAFGAVYLIAAPTTLRRRAGQLLAGAAAMLASCGWWVAIVALWPSGSRPMIDGSSDNSILNLIFGYNGLGRIFGSGGPGGGGGGGANFSGPTGVLRLFDAEMGGQASWMLPAALIALVAGLYVTRRAPRTDRTRAALVLWGGWLIVTAMVFSFGSGVIHTYYTVALAPAIAALIAIGGAALWPHRDALAARLTVALAVGASAAWSIALLDRTPTWESWLRPLIAVAAVLGIAALIAGPALRRVGRPLAIAGVLAAIIASLAGPTAYALETISSPHTGSIPSAGPASSATMGGPGGGFGGVRPAGGPTGGAAVAQLFGRGGRTGATGAGGFPGGPTGGRPGGATGGGQTTTSAALVKALETGAGDYHWVAAVDGSQSAASLELATGGDPVMAIGGFNGQGGNLSLKQFEAYVAKGEIHYYIAGGGMGGGPGGAGTSSEITSWVRSHFKSQTIGGETVYVLSEAR